MANKINDLTRDRLEGEDGLLKIPVEALLKLANQEIGALKSYIDELEEDKKNLQSELKKVEGDRKSIITQFNSYKERDTLHPLIVTAKHRINFYKEMNKHLGRRKKVYKNTVKQLLEAIVNVNGSYEDLVHTVCQIAKDNDLHNMEYRIYNITEWLKTH